MRFRHTQLLRCGLKETERVLYCSAYVSNLPRSESRRFRTDPHDDFKVRFGVVQKVISCLQGYGCFTDPAVTEYGYHRPRSVQCLLDALPFAAPSKKTGLIEVSRGQVVGRLGKCVAGKFYCQSKHMRWICF